MIIKINIHKIRYNLKRSNRYKKSKKKKKIGWILLKMKKSKIIHRINSGIHLEITLLKKVNLLKDKNKR